MIQREPASKKAKRADGLPGIIDTIGNAFALLNRRPYLIWPPIVLDLVLWLGVSVSAAPMIGRFEAWILPQLSPDDQAVAVLGEVRQANLLVLLAIMMPSLLRALGSGSVAELAGLGSAVNFSWWVLPFLAGGLALVGAFVGVAYLTMIGFLVRGRPIGRTLLVESAINGLRTLGFVVISIAAFVLISMPILVMTTVMLALGVNVVGFTTAIMTLAVVWYLFMLFFALHAIVVSGVGPFRAMYLSYNVVRSNFWASFGFVVTYLAIRHGVPIALGLFTQSPWSVPFALIVNAYIATGITASAMLFYRDRARQLGSAPDTPSTLPRQPS